MHTSKFCKLQLSLVITLVLIFKKPNTSVSYSLHKNNYHLFTKFEVMVMARYGCRYFDQRVVTDKEIT